MSFAFDQSDEIIDLRRELAAARLELQQRATRCTACAVVYDGVVHRFCPACAMRDGEGRMKRFIQSVEQIHALTSPLAYDSGHTEDARIAAGILRRFHEFGTAEDPLVKARAEVARLQSRERDHLNHANDLVNQRRVLERECDGWRRIFDSALESRVAAWVRSRIGEWSLVRRERTIRFFEEAVELTQAEGISREMAIRQVEHVYSRPAGEPAQEAAGVAVTLLGWCAATGNRLVSLALDELDRIEAKPLEEIRGSLARKTDADLVTCAAAKENPDA